MNMGHNKSEYGHVFCKNTYITYCFISMVLSCILLYLQFHGQPRVYDNVLGYLNTAFTVLFTIEALLKLMAFGVRVRHFCGISFYYFINTLLSSSMIKLTIYSSKIIVQYNWNVIFFKETIFLKSFYYGYIFYDVIFRDVIVMSL